MWPFSLGEWCRLSVSGHQKVSLLVRRQGKPHTEATWKHRNPKVTWRTDQSPTEKCSKAKGQIEIQSRKARRQGKDQNPTQKLRKNENPTPGTVPKNPKKITGDTQMSPNSADKEMTQNDQNSARYQAMTAQWPQMTAQNGSCGHEEGPQMHAWQGSGLEIAERTADDPQIKENLPEMTNNYPCSQCCALQLTLVGWPMGSAVVWRWWTEPDGLALCQGWFVCSYRVALRDNGLWVWWTYKMVFLFVFVLLLDWLSELWAYKVII